MERDFKGKDLFYSCNLILRYQILISSYTLSLGHFINYPDGDVAHPEVQEREWELNPFNFDDVTNGLLTLFTVATFEGLIKKSKFGRNFYI